MKNQRLFALLVGALLAARPVCAQLPARAAFASDEAAARHRTAFAAVVRKAGFRFPAAMFYKYRIDVTKEAALRRAGCDLRELDRRIRIDGPGGFQESSLFADLVVHGTVLSLVPDSSRSACYHSAYRVRVAETWQGRPADTLTVRLFSGPLGNSGNITFAEAPRIEVGEEAILHLRYVDFSENEEAKKLGLSLCTNNAAPGDCGLLLASPVRGEWVLDHYGQRPLAPLADLRRDLQRIAALLDKEHFYQKEF
ncbi:hypothetical protein [Hymenobacter negativus]|uniref:Uncharacterized protein n=1 Tax=Hymenobacter negativus TaxID=2795026 RepID=A0ABS3QM79_9BACT|nr:hypothetical protein [Hymenobacter negativus]MBO2012053.1 hypothetical protein [Hymenobacter negativus]